MGTEKTEKLKAEYESLSKELGIQSSNPRLPGFFRFTIAPDKNVTSEAVLEDLVSLLRHMKDVKEGKAANTVYYATKGK